MTISLKLVSAQATPTLSLSLEFVLRTAVKLSFFFSNHFLVFFKPFFGFLVLLQNFFSRCLQLCGGQHLGGDCVEGFPPDQPGQPARQPQHLLHPSPCHQPHPKYDSKVTNADWVKVSKKRDASNIRMKTFQKHQDADFGERCSLPLILCSYLKSINHCAVISKA